MFSGWPNRLFTKVSSLLSLGRDKSVWTGVSIDQYRLDLLSRSSPVPYNEVASPGVSITVLCTRSVHLKVLWERWIQDGRKYLESRSLKPDLLQVFVHPASFIEPALVRQATPPSAKIIPDELLGNCTWQKINPCFHAALAYPLSTFKEAEWFLTVSHDSFPVKPFGKLYESLSDDRRSRFAWAHLSFTSEHIPKASNWFILSRKHTEILVNNPADWLNEGFTSGVTGAAGPDEWAPFKCLLRRINNETDFFASQVHPATALTPEAMRSNSDYYNMYALWHDCDLVGIHSPGVPCKFKTIYRRKLEGIMRDPGLFFARKAHPKLTVIPHPLLSIDRNSGEVTLLGREKGWMPMKLADQSQPITDFMTSRLQLQSDFDSPEDDVPEAELPAGYKSLFLYEDLIAFLVSNRADGLRESLLT